MTGIFLDADGLFRFRLFLFKSLFRSESLSRTTVLPYITSIHLPTPSLPFAITHKVRSASQYLPGHRTHASHTSQGVMHFMQSSSHAVHTRQVSNEKCRQKLSITSTSMLIPYLLIHSCLHPPHAQNRPNNRHEDEDNGDSCND